MGPTNFLQNMANVAWAARTIAHYARRIVEALYWC